MKQLSLADLTVAQVAALKSQAIETPSWGYGNSGTRFKTFPWPGAATTVWEKIEDAAEVHRLTGIAPSVALHIPWDKPMKADGSDRGAPVSELDWAGLAKFATDRGVRLGAINSNTFQNDVYKFGSLAHPDASVRAKAIAHMKECCSIMEITGSADLSVWLADGTNYAGQDSIRGRKHRVREALSEVYASLPSGSRMLVEYKFFEPAFYFTDLFDWGAALTHCLALGPQAQVLVDLGHHAPGTNIEAIVAFLLDEGRLGGFHFNARRYADDDLIVGTTNPYELFLIYVEIVSALNSDDQVAKDAASKIAYMIDQSHNIEPKVEAMVQSVLNCQEAFAKALLVDQEALREKQISGDVLGAHRELYQAFQTDVRPLLAELREDMGVPTDPIASHRASGYNEKVAAERGSADSGSGYPTE